jgi:hypothetical protein
MEVFYLFVFESSGAATTHGAFLALTFLIYLRTKKDMQYSGLRALSYIQE